jgi:hypothetical protein
VSGRSSPEALAQARRVTLDALVDEFAREQLSEAEFDRRTAAARAAGSVAELRRLLADLPGSS